MIVREKISKDKNYEDEFKTLVKHLYKIKENATYTLSGDKYIYHVAWSSDDFLIINLGYHRVLSITDKRIQIEKRKIVDRIIDFFLFDYERMRQKTIERQNNYKIHQCEIDKRIDHDTLIEIIEDLKPLLKK